MCHHDARYEHAVGTGTLLNEQLNTPSLSLSFHHAGLATTAACLWHMHQAGGSSALSWPAQCLAARQTSCAADETIIASSAACATSWLECLVGNSTLCCMQAASQNNLEGLLSIVEKAGESFDGETVAAALQQVRPLGVKET